MFMSPDGMPIGAINLLMQYVPHLIAVSASSPCQNGELADTAIKWGTYCISKLMAPIGMPSGDMNMQAEHDALIGQPRQTIADTLVTLIGVNRAGSGAMKWMRASHRQLEAEGACD